MAKARRPYNRRDLIGHWVRKRQRTKQMCEHACCRGKRVHPANFPIILSRSLVRSVTEGELVDHLRRYPTQAGVHRQVEAELRRRENVAKRRDAAAFRRSQRKSDAEGNKELYLRQAEAATNGYLVNAKGRARGVSARAVMLGDERTALRYGTREALDYRSDHPKPTRTSKGQRSRSRLGVGY